MVAKSKPADTESLKKALRKKTPKRSRTISTKSLLSTGSTLLDLQCTGRWQGGLVKGLCYWLVGDSDSGKTFTSLTCLAEAAKNPEFDGYRFIHDNAENGALMDVVKFFGKPVADRLEPPRRTKDGSPENSASVEEFYFNLDDVLKTGPCIYILDSMEALTTAQEETKFNEAKTAFRKGKEAAGDYGMAKAKINSMRLRKILGPLTRTGSILIIISQTRDNVGAGLFGEKSKAGGGRSLKFYSRLMISTSPKGQIKKTVRKKQRQVGVLIRARVKKNHLTGKLGSVDIPIYWSYGIDNTGSMIDYLVSEGHWTKKKGVGIEAPEFEFTGSRDDLVRHVEENELDRDLKEITAEVWHEIEEAMSLGRKPRY